MSWCGICGKETAAPHYDSRGFVAFCDNCWENAIATGMIAQCEDCGIWVMSSSHARIRMGRHVCRRCASRYVRCEHCGKEWHLDGPRYYAGHILCDECRISGDCCESCGRYTTEGIGYSGEVYCPECIVMVDHEFCENEGLIYPYHSSHELTWDLWAPVVGEHEYIPDREKFRGYGLELEVEHGENTTPLTSTVIKHIKHRLDRDTLFCIERDGSLHYGFELVSRPFTQAGWPEMYETTARIMDYLRASGYEAGSEDCNCGLHIHVSKTMLHPITQGKLLVLADKFEGELFLWSRRTCSSFSTWATPLNTFRSEWERLEPVDHVIGVAERYVLEKKGRRHVAINVNNSHTVEFRFFKGTLMPDELRAAFDAVNFLVGIAGELTADEVFRMSEDEFRKEAMDFSPTLKRYIKRLAGKEEAVA